MNPEEKKQVDHLIMKKFDEAENLCTELFKNLELQGENPENKELPKEGKELSKKITLVNREIKLMIKTLKES